MKKIAGSVAALLAAGLLSGLAPFTQATDTVDPALYSGLK